MTCYLCVTPERPRKTRMLMTALSTGLPDGRIIYGPPPKDRNPFIVWGQMFLALDILPGAVASNRKFWHIDNGFWLPACGSMHGFYRMTYRGLSPILLREPMKRFRPTTLRTWRKDGTHVLIALPGPDFGKAIGIDVRAWINDIEQRVRASTDRPIVIRPKRSSVPLQEQLKNCWALVTHSSNVAVDAVMSGIPVFVAPTSPAAPVGRLDLDIEHPLTPDRDHWLRSLMVQQYTLNEMKTGFAYHWMKQVAAQVDGVRHEDRTNPVAAVVGQDHQVQICS